MVRREAELLRDRGHEVREWSPQVNSDGAVAQVASGVAAVWARAARAHIAETVRAWTPDVLHFHNLFPLVSPAALRRSVTARTPTVMTLHNYRLTCLSGSHFRNGAVCEKCLGRAPWPGVVHGCYRGSAVASVPIAASLIAHRRIGSFRSVDQFLAVSKFVRAKMIEAGMPGERVIVKPNFVPQGARRRANPGGALLYAGRLSSEKGINVLVAAQRLARVPLRVVGVGPLEGLAASAVDEQLTFDGPAPNAQVREMLKDTGALIAPSINYEGAPISILEAYAAGVPVIASDIGGLAELVEHNRTGYLVPPADVEALARCMQSISEPSTNARMGLEARERWERLYSPGAAYRNLLAAYASARARALAPR